MQGRCHLHMFYFATLPPRGPHRLGHNKAKARYASQVCVCCCALVVHILHKFSLTTLPLKGS